VSIAQRIWRRFVIGIC